MEGAFEGRGECLSRNGLVVAGEGGTNDGYRVFRWSAADGIQSLGSLNNNISYAYAYAIDYAGTTIVGTEVPKAGSAKAFRWRNGMYGLPPANGVSFGPPYADSTSGDGKTLVGATYSPSGPLTAYKWTLATGTQLLPNLSGDDGGIARCISPDGQVIVGNTQFDNSHRHAALWDAGGVHALPVPNGHTYSEAYACNKDGSIAVGATGVASNTIGMILWTNAASTFIGIPQGDTFVIPHGISDNGNVVIANGDVHACFWTPQSGFVPLQNYLAARGIDMSQYQITNLGGLSADGKTIAGTVTVGGAASHAFICTIDLPPAPQSVTFSPSTVTGGQSTFGKVTLSAPAQANTTIHLTSANTAIATVPASITIYKGKTNASFVVQSKTVSVVKHLQITAKLNLASAKGTLTVNP